MLYYIMSIIYFTTHAARDDAISFLAVVIVCMVQNNASMCELSPQEKKTLASPITRPKWATKDIGVHRRVVIPLETEAEHIITFSCPRRRCARYVWV